MLTQEQADSLIALLKESVANQVFDWYENLYQEEFFVDVEIEKIRFILSLKRNPYEIRLHLRTQDRHIGLARIDGAKYHPNPDGTELRDTPHIHWYREGYEKLEWAEPIDWYNTSKPIQTLERFLSEINARFRNGIQLMMV
jgi:phage anti-repressor protein